MTIPKSFKFLGKRYRVYFTDLTHGDNWGTTNINAQTIEIEQVLSQELREETFLHELLHVIMSEMGISDSLDIDAALEEKLVNALSHGLYAVIDIVK